MTPAACSPALKNSQSSDVQRPCHPEMCCCVNAVGFKVAVRSAAASLGMDAQSDSLPRGRPASVAMGRGGGRGRHGDICLRETRSEMGLQGANGGYLSPDVPLGRRGTQSE